jgi:hypothetical protein
MLVSVVTVDGLVVVLVMVKLQPGFGGKLRARHRVHPDCFRQHQRQRGTD